MDRNIKFQHMPKENMSRSNKIMCHPRLWLVKKPVGLVIIWVAQITYLNISFIHQRPSWTNRLTGCVKLARHITKRMPGKRVVVRCDFACEIWVNSNFKYTNNNKSSVILEAVVCSVNQDVMANNHQNPASTSRQIMHFVLGGRIQSRKIALAWTLESITSNLVTFLTCWTRASICVPCFKSLTCIQQVCIIV